jgi:putative ABC transport system permease protein
MAATNMLFGASSFERFYAVPLAWLQLRQEPARLLAAVCGVVFAVILVFMQLGFSEALYASAVRLHQAVDADLLVINPGSRSPRPPRPRRH